MATDNTTYAGYWGAAVIDCRHYDYTLKHQEWELIEKALEGGKIWTKEVIEKYECESQGKLDLRKKWAWDRISITPPLQAFQNMARGSADQARIDGASERIQNILDEDFDNNGNQWYSWLVENAGLNVPAYGKYFIFASSPANITPLTLKDEKDFHPFAFGRTPLQVLNWQYENGDTRTNGQFSDILFLTSEVVTNEQTRYQEHVPTAVRMTKDFILVMAVDDCSAYTTVTDDSGNTTTTIGQFEKGEIIRVVENPIGVVPCRMVDIGESVIRGVINASAQAMNVQSGMFVGVFDGNYNQKVLSGGSKEEGDLDLGTHTVLELSEGSKFEIVEAPSGEVDVAIKFFEDTQNGVDVILQQQYANLAKKGGNAPSGEALTQINSDRVQAVKVVMDLSGDAMEDIVAWMHLLAGEKVPTTKTVEDPETGKMVEVPSELRVIMPNSYESNTEKDRMEIALDAQDITVSTEKGLRIRENTKWSQLAAPSELADVVDAEVQAQLPMVTAMNDMDNAVLSSGDTINQFDGGDTENQDSGDAQNQEESLDGV